MVMVMVMECNGDGVRGSAMWRFRCGGDGGGAARHTWNCSVAV